MKFTGDFAKTGISFENKGDLKSKPAAVSLKCSVQEYWTSAPGQVNRESSQFKATLLAVQPKQKRNIT